MSLALTRHEQLTATAIVRWKQLGTARRSFVLDALREAQEALITAERASNVAMTSPVEPLQSAQELLTLLAIEARHPPVHERLEAEVQTLNSITDVLKRFGFVADGSVTEADFIDAMLTRFQGGGPDSDHRAAPPETLGNA